jgi:glucokinase
VVNLVNIMSPELVCISGGICNAPDDLLLNPLADFVRKNVYPPISDDVKICKSLLGGDAPLIGATLLYKDAAAHNLFQVWAAK